MPTPAIHCLALPTRLAVGDVNAYVIDADPLTLVDTGPPTPEALSALERGLREHRRRLEDVELVVLTHQHIDHVGLAPLIAERSGAQVAAAAGLSGYLADLARAREEDIAVFSALMDQYGVPRGMASRSLAAWRSRGSERRGTTVDLPLAAGDAVTIGDWALEALPRPGHSPSDTVFHDRRTGLAFGGDHLLARISSNATLCRAPDRPWDGRRPRPLLEYRDSLRRTHDLDLRMVLPGHGAAIGDHRPLIRARLAAHDARARRIGELLGDTPRTAHAIAVDLWGERAAQQPLLSLSEVLGHADLLAEAGDIEELTLNGVVHLRRTHPNRRRDHA